jgi:hypothetical protein
VIPGNMVMNVLEVGPGLRRNREPRHL